VFDCKQEACRKVMVRAPLVRHYLCPSCAEHLGGVTDALQTLGVPCNPNPYLVRGLDYYVRTTFEIVSPHLGSQSTVAAGGRYDGLVRDLGGPDLPGVGMAIGVERLMLLLEEDGGKMVSDLFVAALGPEARQRALTWVQAWRRNDLVVQMSYEDKSLKAQLKQADRAGARYVLIVGENELASGELILRDMAGSEQQKVALPDVVSLVEGIVGEED
jgi:histidyl-tRNA synthetase